MIATGSTACIRLCASAKEAHRTRTSRGASSPETGEYVLVHRNASTAASTARSRSTLTRLYRNCPTADPERYPRPPEVALVEPLLEVDDDVVAVGLPMVLRIAEAIGSLCVPSPSAMNEPRKPNAGVEQVPATLTSALRTPRPSRASARMSTCHPSRTRHDVAVKVMSSGPIVDCDMACLLGAARRGCSPGRRNAMHRPPGRSDASNATNSSHTARPNSAGHPNHATRPQPQGLTPFASASRCSTTSRPGMSRGSRRISRGEVGSRDRIECGRGRAFSGHGDMDEHPAQVDRSLGEQCTAAKSSSNTWPARSTTLACLAIEVDHVVDVIVAG